LNLFSVIAAKGRDDAASARIPVKILVMIEVFVNGEIKKVQSPKVVNELLEDLQLYGRKGIAVAVNEEVLTKSQWQEVFLKPFDKVVIIKAVAGG
jgi:sulfur carrier protein